MTTFVDRLAMPRRWMSAAMMSVIVAAAGLGAAGCAATVKEGAAEIRVRNAAAALEAQMLAAPAPPRPEPAAALSPEAAARIADLERQVAEIRAALQQAQAQNQAAAPAAVAQAPAPMPTAEAPAAAAESTTPAAPAGRQKIAKLLTIPTAGYSFTNWSSGKISMSKDLMEKFAANAKRVSDSSNRPDLVGKPLARTRFLGPTGEVFDLADYAGQKKVVLVFMRGFASEICIGCSTYTVALARAQAQFADRDAQVVIVYPGNPSSVPAFLKSVAAIDPKVHIDYPILLDVNLGAVNALMIQGSLAKPSSIIIDKDGLVSYAYVGKRFDDRPSVATLLGELDQAGM